MLFDARIEDFARDLVREIAPCGCQAKADDECMYCIQALEVAAHLVRKIAIEAIESARPTEMVQFGERSKWQCPDCGLTWFDLTECEHTVTPLLRHLVAAYPE